MASREFLKLLKALAEFKAEGHAVLSLKLVRVKHVNLEQLFDGTEHFNCLLVFALCW